MYHVNIPCKVLGFEVAHCLCSCKLLYKNHIKFCSYISLSSDVTHMYIHSELNTILLVNPPDIVQRSDAFASVMLPPAPACCHAQLKLASTTNLPSKWKLTPNSMLTIQTHTGGCYTVPDLSGPSGCVLAGKDCAFATDSCVQVHAARSKSCLQLPWPSEVSYNARSFHAKNDQT